jgi:hypothetical protein
MLVWIVFVWAIIRKGFACNFKFVCHRVDFPARRVWPVPAAVLYRRCVVSPRVGGISLYVA